MRKAVCALLALALAAGASLTMVGARAADTSFATIEKGHRLVDAGDCAGCHTMENGKAFAGGKAIPTPFGTVYAPNITPDREDGDRRLERDGFLRAPCTTACGRTAGISIRHFPIPSSPSSGATT